MLGHLVRDFDGHLHGDTVAQQLVWRSQRKYPRYCTQGKSKGRDTGPSPSVMRRLR
jgi:hypothetical protein